MPVQGIAGFGTFEAGAAALMGVYGGGHGGTYNVPLADGLQAALALHLIMLACAVGAGGLAAAFLPGEPKLANKRADPDRSPDKTNASTK